MLRQLSIKNLALIDELTIDFQEGLNILTGETGAGKSIIIDGVNLVLGERADRELIQSGKDYARVEGVFDMGPLDQAAALMMEYGITPEEDGTLILMREITLNGKNTCRINGRSVTLSMLKEISQLLVDIHGQHQHQSLLSVEAHMNLLDRLGGQATAALKDKVEDRYRRWRSLQQEMDRLLGIGKDGERRKDLLSYQIDEISKARLKPGEDEELLKERSILQHAEKIMDVIHDTYEALYSGSKGSLSITEGLGKLMNRLSQITQLDSRLDNISAQLESVYYQLEDIVLEVRDYKEGFEYNPSRLDELEKRLLVIETMKRKYGTTIEEVLEFKQQLEKEALELKNTEQRVEELEIEKIHALQELVESCRELSRNRQKVGKFFEENLMEQLAHLGMGKSRFSVEIESPDSSAGLEGIDTRLLSRHGYDRIEFLISPNPGEPLRPLAKIISGGEMSRVMLAFKTILAGVDDIPTLIFDEIDVGISGRMAQVVAEKMGDISRSHQVICVTHLPQIAAMADTHFRIEKVFVDGHTRTSMKGLDRESRREEVARMIGGATVSQLSLDHALELIESAEDYKNEKLSDLVINT